MGNAKDNLKAIYTAAIEAVNPENAVKDHVKVDKDILTLISDEKEVKSYKLNDFKRIIVVGAGKATSPMAKAIEDILGDRIIHGCVVVKYGYTEKLNKIETIEASHPIPDTEGVSGAKKIVEILNNTEKGDLVISLISGGGSALLPLPAEGITLDEKRETTDLLLKSGAAIHEVNSIRKHLSLVKGGNMARAAQNATVINLMISDVVGDDMDVIASGPFVPDNSTFADALSILNKYNLVTKVPGSVLKRINDGVEKKIDENPDSESPAFKKVTNLIVASNIIALKSAKEEAEKRGYNCLILSSLIEGDTRDTALWHSRIAREVINSSNPIAAPACIISGGETTVIVKGDGLGGRSMEFAMQSALFIDGLDNVTMASIGTDGTDGPTDAAGAYTDGSIMRKCREKGIDINSYINNNDAYHFHKEMDTLIITGPTNTNVMDVRLLLIE